MGIISYMYNIYIYTYVYRLVNFDHDLMSRRNSFGILFFFDNRIRGSASSAV